jgi:cytochrome c oxidase assembly protein subunit 11
VLTYVAAAAVGMLGASYAAVPLYRLYCQVREGTKRGTDPT